jgi:hypothetical protein
MQHRNTAQVGCKGGVTQLHSAVDWSRLWKKEAADGLRLKVRGQVSLLLKCLLRRAGKSMFFQEVASKTPEGSMHDEPLQLLV